MLCVIGWMGVNVTKLLRLWATPQLICAIVHTKAYDHKGEVCFSVYNILCGLKLKMIIKLKKNKPGQNVRYENMRCYITKKKETSIKFLSRLCHSSTFFRNDIKKKF